MSITYCIVCGQKKPNKNRYYCSKKCMGEGKQNWKICVVCEKPFKDSVTNPTKCCSTACSKINRRQIKSTMANFEKLLPAKKKFQDEHIGEKNVTAKYWIIQSPDGKTYEIKNLFYFIKSNPELFDGTPKQAFDGFQKIKATATGKRKINPSHSWKGWRLISWS